MSELRRVVVVTVVLFLGAVALAGKGPDALRASHTVLERPARDARDALPIGNGDIGVSAWVDAQGVLTLLIGKTDAWGEHGRLLKVGRLEQLKSQFIHQFLLAGVLKFIKKRKYAEARQVMDLSKHPEMQQLRLSPKWFPVKVTFSLYLWFSQLFPSATSSR